jgi:hypothetical protein
MRFHNRKDKTNMAEMNKVEDSQRMDTLDAQGNWSYPSAAESGHVEVELPSLPGSPNAVERLHARDFGPHVIGKIEASLTQNPYLKSGPQQNPAGVFRHYASVMKGSSLMDRATVARMESLAKEFETEPDQGEYFAQVVRPYLRSLTPKRRQP